MGQRKALGQVPQRMWVSVTRMQDSRVICADLLPGLVTTTCKAYLSALRPSVCGVFQSHYLLGKADPGLDKGERTTLDTVMYLLWMSCSHTWRATARTIAWDCRSPCARRKHPLRTGRKPSAIAVLLACCSDSTPCSPHIGSPSIGLAPMVQARRKRFDTHGARLLGTCIKWQIKSFWS